MLNERVNLLVKRSTNAIDNNKILVHKLTQLEQERDALRMMIGGEKQKVLDMQTLLHQSRTPTATAVNGTARTPQSVGNHESGLTVDSLNNAQD